MLFGPKYSPTRTASEPRSSSTTSNIAVVEVSGQEQSARKRGIRYRAFGKRFTLSGGNPARRDPSFQNRTYDAGLGIYDYRNRSFDPATGRFLQRDPVLGGDSLFNPYVFPGNNPVGNVDPMGTRILVAKNAQAKYNKWLNKNKIYLGPGRQTSYIWPQKNEGATASWYIRPQWFCPDIGVEYNSRFTEHVLTSNVDITTLSKKEMIFLAAMIDQRNTYVFDKNGWRIKTDADEASTHAAAHLAFGRARESVGNFLADAGDKFDEWDRDIFIPMEAFFLQAGPPGALGASATFFAGKIGLGLRGLRIAKTGVYVARLGKKVLPKVAAMKRMKAFKKLLEYGKKGRNLLAKLRGGKAGSLTGKTAAQVKGLELVDLMPPARLKNLAKSVAAKGFTNPTIEVVQAGGKKWVLYGSNRMCVARKLGMLEELVIKEVSLPHRGFKTFADVVDLAWEAKKVAK